VLPVIVHFVSDLEIRTPNLGIWKQDAEKNVWP